MVNWPEAWQKLLDKRVDIVANILTGVLLAALAIGSWRLQQAWARRIERKHRRADELAARHETVRRMRDTRARFIGQASQIPLFQSAQLTALDGADELIRELLVWLRASDLRNHANNSRMYENLRTTNIADVGSHAGLQEVLRRIGSDLAELDLPRADDDNFHW